MKRTQVEVPKTATNAKQESSRILRRERILSEEEAKEVKLAAAERPEEKPEGVYRVIHGRVYVARPTHEWRNEDGTIKPGQASMEVAYPGYEIFFTSADATMLWAAGQLETLDAKPSRVNKVFSPPKTIPNQHAIIGGGR